MGLLYITPLKTGTLWTPASMPNLWLGVDPTTSLNSTTWVDGWSGSSRDLTVTSGTISTTTLNGRTVPSFSNNANQTLKTAVNFPQTGDSAFTMFAAFQAADTTNTWGICGFGDAAFTPLGAAYLVPIGGGDLVVGFAGGNDYHPNYPVTTNLILVTITKSPGPINSTTSVRVNGTPISSLGGDSTGTPNITSTPFFVGQLADYSSLLFSGSIGAIFATTIVSNLSDIQKMENYINHLFSPTIF